MRKWDPEDALDLIEREGLTSFAGVPVLKQELRKRFTARHDDGDSSGPPLKPLAPER
jgi:hypothetical protein